MAGYIIKVTSTKEGRVRVSGAWVSHWTVKTQIKLPCGAAHGSGGGRTRNDAYAAAAAQAVSNARIIQRRCASSGAHAKHPNS